MDKSKIDQALDTLIHALPSVPDTVILVTREGRFLSRIGELPTRIFNSVDDNQIAVLIQSHALNQIEMLDGLNLDNYQFSVSIGGSGIILIFHLNDTYLLGISFYTKIVSVEAVIESVLENFQPLLDALYAI
jgi:hypothetical protein